MGTEAAADDQGVSFGGSVPGSLLSESADSRRFLQREFLLWLWHVSETRSTGLVIKSPRGARTFAVDMSVDDRIALQSTTSQNQAHIIKGGVPSQSSEAGIALVVGRSVSELRVGISIDGIGEFSALLRSDDLLPRALRLPKSPSAEGMSSGDGPEPDRPIQLRVDLIDTFLDVFDGLFLEFLTCRTAKTWASDDLPKIVAWTRDRAAKFEVKLLH